MGAFLVDAGYSPVYCEGDPAIDNGYCWWMRYQGTVQMFYVNRTNGDALVAAAKLGWVNFDGLAALTLGTDYSSQSTGTRKAVWSSAARILT